MIRIRGVGLQISKSAQANAATLKSLERPVLVARIMAEHIRERVQRRGRLATQEASYQGGQHPFLVSREYLEQLGLQVEGDAGFRRFSSSAEFHAAAGIRYGRYAATAAMWRGLRVRNYGRTGAVIDVARSSLGRSVKRKSKKERAALTKRIRDHAKVQIKARKTQRAKQNARDRRDRKLRQVNSAAKPRRVQNRHKLSVIWRAHRVNPLQPTDAEVRAINSAVMRHAQLLVAKRLGATITHWRGSGDQRLVRKLLHHLRRL